MKKNNSLGNSILSIGISVILLLVIVAFIVLEQLGKVIFINTPLFWTLDAVFLISFAFALSSVWPKFHDLMKKLMNTIGNAKFAFIVVALLLLLSILGSIISESSVDQIKHNGFIKLFFDPDTNDFRRFCATTGILTIYKTPLFLTLLFLFTVSLTVCTYRLIPFAMKGYKIVNPMALKETQNTSKSIEELQTYLDKHNWNVKQDEKTGVYMATKHRSGRWGVIILHTGIFTVMLGAFIGYYFGYKSFAAVYEGQTINAVELNNGKQQPLGFKLRVDRFDVDFYPGTRTVKSYTSGVTVIDDGKEVLKTDIDVNTPLKYDGVVFYQASYGEQANMGMNFDLTFRVNGQEITKTVPYGQPVLINEAYMVKIVDVMPTIGMDANGEFISTSAQFQDPAIYMVLYNSDGKAVADGPLRLYEKEFTTVPNVPVTLKLDEMHGHIYTGLSVKKDPATAIVYLGGILMIFGVMFIYLLNYTSVCFTLNNGQITYNVRQQRKFPIVRPFDNFKKFIDME